MADTRAEIERLNHQLRQTQRDMESIHAEYIASLNREIARIRKKSDTAMRDMRREVQGQFAAFQNSLSDAYLHEIENMHERYDAIATEAERTERALELEIEALRKQQETLRQRQINRDEREHDAASDAFDRWKVMASEIGQYPVDILFPNKVHIYLEAGQEAERLLQEHLYGLSAAQFESAMLGMQRLKLDTVRQMDEIKGLLQLYCAKLDEIERVLELGDVARLKDESGKEILRLDAEDLDYWSDCLYGQLIKELHGHRVIAAGNAADWIVQNASATLPPAYLLDKRIQALDSMPGRLRVCISYAMSACDSYNGLFSCRDTLISIMGEQNYTYVDTTFGPRRLEKTASEGYDRYARFLANERCCRAGEPDYREERVVRFQKTYSDGSTDVCRVLFVPLRRENVVTCGVFLELDAQRIPELVEQELVQRMTEAHIPVQIVRPGQSLNNGRALNGDELTRLAGVQTQRQIQTKYSL